MKITVQVGAVTVQTHGLDLTRRDLRQLLKEAASIAVALGADPDTEEPERPPLGFSAHLERLPDDLPPDPQSE